MKTFINPRRISPIYQQEYDENRERVRRMTKKDWLEIFPEAIDYLEIDLIDQTEKLNLLEQLYSNQLDINNYLKTQDAKDFAEIQTDIFIGEDIKATEHRIKEINQFIGPDAPIHGSITAQDIENAKEYPFDQLIELKRGRALCPFHTEKTPSLYLNKKNNTVHCFGACGKTWDTIQFLIESEGISFIQSVKKLRGG